jgi:hypothetical protein
MPETPDYNLYFDNVAMPAPAKEGIVETNQLIWSENAGRTANGTFVGDIIAEKKTLVITWNEMTYTQLALIQNHISRYGHPFITVKYWTAGGSSAGQQKTFTGYTDGSTSTIVTYTPDGKIAGVTLNVIEK